MRVVAGRKVCVVLWLLLAPGVWAQDRAMAPNQGAMLAGKGAVMVNGQTASGSQALLPGDLVVTPADGGGNITLDGTSLVVVGGAAARYEGMGITLERGAVSVGTQKGFFVRTGCLSVSPVEPDQWTEFAVTDLENGTVTVLARKGAVNVSEAGKTDRLEAGKEITRPSCLAERREKERARRQGGAATAASTGPLNSPYAIYGGAAVAGTLVGIILTRHPEPVSPEKP
jgi:hypothetical protein